MKRLLITLAFAFAAGPAFAQGDPSADPGAIAHSLIETANAAGVFEIVPDGRISVRHVGSSLTCHFSDASGRLLLFPGPRGEDVGCDMRAGAATITLYATRYPGPTTLEELMFSAVQAIRQRFPDAQIFPGTLDVSVEGHPTSQTAEFFVMINGARYYSCVSIAIVNGWAIKLRYSAPAPDADAARQGELLAGLVFSAALIDIVAVPNL